MTIAEIAARHTKVTTVTHGYGTTPSPERAYCYFDSQPWPCDASIAVGKAILLLDAMEKIQHEFSRDNQRPSSALFRMAGIADHALAALETPR